MRQLPQTIVGNGLLLHHGLDRTTLVALHGGCASKIGTYTNTKEVWRVIDSIDLAERAGTAALDRLTTA